MSNPGSSVHGTWGRRLTGAAVIVATLLATNGAFAETYPSRPIKLVVGYPPGGSNDIVARILAPHLGKELGTSVVVENRPGANGLIGADYVVMAAPDGYNLLVASASPVVITPHTVDKVQFDTLRDFTPINTVALTPEVIAVRPDLEVTNLKELIALAKTRQIYISSSGNGGLPHLTIELLKKGAQGNIVHVPYKGAMPAVSDTIARHVDAVVMDLPPLYPMINSHKLRALAVTSEKRVDFLPNVPTAQEVLPGFNVVNWVGVFAPAKTPGQVVGRINAALVKIVAKPDVREQFARVAVVPSTMASPAAFQKFVEIEFVRWGKAVKEAGAGPAK